MHARQLERPEAWLDAVETAGHGTEATGPIDRAGRAAEMLLLGLRLAEGVSLARFETVVGAPFAALFPPRALDPLVGSGLLAHDGVVLRATERGRRVLDGVLDRLLGAMASPARARSHKLHPGYP